MIGRTCHRTLQGQPLTVSFTRNLQSRELSLTMATHSLRRAKRAVQVASCGYRRTQAQATITHNCPRLVLPSQCLEAKLNPEKTKTTVYQAQDSTNLNQTITYQASSSSIQGDPRQTSRRTAMSTQSGHRNTPQSTQAKHLRASPTLASG